MQLICSCSWLPPLKRSYEPPHEETKNVVSEQVRHKPSCASTEDRLRLEIVEAESKGIVLSV